MARNGEGEVGNEVRTSESQEKGKAKAACPQQTQINQARPQGQGRLTQRCDHFVVDQTRWDPETSRFNLWRTCLICGVSYNRTEFLEKLEASIRNRSRLPSWNSLDELEWWTR